MEAGMNRAMRIKRGLASARFGGRRAPFKSPCGRTGPMHGIAWQRLSTVHWQPSAVYAFRTVQKGSWLCELSSRRWLAKTADLPARCFLCGELSHRANTDLSSDSTCSDEREHRPRAGYARAGEDHYHKRAYNASGKIEPSVSDDTYTVIGIASGGFFIFGEPICLSVNKAHSTQPRCMCPMFMSRLSRPLKTF